VYLPWRFALGAGAATVLLCLVGSLLPSIRAAYVAVPVALRQE